MSRGYTLDKTSVALGISCEDRSQKTYKLSRLYALHLIDVDNGRRAERYRYDLASRDAERIPLLFSVEKLVGSEGDVYGTRALSQDRKIERVIRHEGE